MTEPTPPEAVDLVLAHELMLDVDTSATATPDWDKVRFTSGINPTITPTMVNVTTYDDDGTERQARTGEAWALAFTIQRYRDNTGAYMPEAEVFRKAADPGVRGDESEVHVRWYDKGGADEAYEGKATVTWARGNTDATGTGTATVTLTGVGKLTPIANPLPVTP